MLHFENDYSQVAHPTVLNELSAISTGSYPGYGSDTVCEQAKAKIRTACGKPDADVWFLVGGTQTNQVGSSTPSRRHTPAWSPSNPVIRMCTRPAPSSIPATKC